MRVVAFATRMQVNHLLYRIWFEKPAAEGLLRQQRLAQERLHLAAEPMTYGNSKTHLPAFKILCGDKNVKAILVNIFGGIMKCDVIANGILIAAEQVGVKVPLVVRLEGTNVEQGRKILAESQLSIITADSMADAGQKVVKAAAAVR